MTASLLEQEIYEQPEVMGRLISTGAESTRRIVAQLHEKVPGFVLIAARGSSDNAANYAKYMFGALNGLPVALAAPSLYTLYRQPPQMRGGLVIGISQSGRGEDILAVLEKAKDQGAPTVAITNAGDSPLARVADYIILLNAGAEHSVAASKTYTAQLTAIAMLAALWNGDTRRFDELQRLPEWAGAALAQHGAAHKIAERFQRASEMIVVSRGFNDATAHEIALKIKELTYIAAEGYSAADLRHGPIALVESGYPVLALAPRGRAFGDMVDTIRELVARGADIALFSNDDALLAGSGLGLQLPADLPEWLSPIVGVIPGQLLALQLALARGFDPDAPRGLNKVTITR
jgi:glutamine---fructose-6-phosphate transaminase (isomerizing)